MQRSEANRLRNALRAWSARLRTTNPDPPISPRRDRVRVQPLYVEVRCMVARNIAREMDEQADELERDYELRSTRVWD